MPVDDKGVKADLIICPKSILSRMNPGQLYEQFINRCSYEIQQKVKHDFNNGIMDVNQAFEYIIDYIHMIRPNYAHYIREKLFNDNMMVDFVHDTIDHGIYMHIPPFSKFITEDLILALSEKYNVVARPIKYNITHANGKKETIHLKNPMIIGEKYTYLLCKIPAQQLSAVESAYVSHLGLPIKPKSKNIKNQFPYNQTPIKLGEDETFIMSQSIGPKTLARLHGLYAGSAIAEEALQNELLTHPNPSQLHKVDLNDNEIIKTNRNLSIFNHQLSLVGYKFHKASDDEVKKLLEELNA